MDPLHKDPHAFLPTIVSGSRISRLASSLCLPQLLWLPCLNVKFWQMCLNSYAVYTLPKLFENTVVTGILPSFSPLPNPQVGEL
jgi:hypothetical protein